MRPGRRVAAAGLLALAAAVGLFGLRPGFLERLELELLDWRFRVRGAEPPAAPVSIVAIDAASIDALGRWPWRRSVMAALLDELTAAGALVIGVDVVFSEPEIPPEAETLRSAREALAAGDAASPAALAVLDRALAAADTDARLERAIAASDRTVLGYFFRTEADRAYDSAPAPGELETALRRVRKSQVAVSRLPVGAEDRLLRCTDVEPNLERFHAAAERVGFFSADVDDDGVVRRSPLVAWCGGRLHVSLDLAVLELLAGDRAMVLADEAGRLVVRLGDLAIPADEGGRVLIDYRGPPRTFPHHSAVDVLEGRVGRAELANRVVLIGPTEAGIQDVYPTPFAKAVPGIEIHANVIDGLIAGEVLRRDQGFVVGELAAILLLGLLVTAVVPRAGGALRGALFAGALLAAGVAVGVWLFVAHGLWVNLAYPAVAVAGVYLAVAITQSVTVEARNRSIRRTFATYVPPEVAEEMIQRPESFRLGGERRELSLLFSDLEDFTGLSEEIGAEGVVELLSGYLEPMTRIVFESRGTLDKYIGDAVVAFWGAPIAVPDHPARACEAAIAMQEAVDRLRRERPELPAVGRLRVRIGIHSATVAVGNMGSALRFDYTVMGDGVNVCSRLEGLNKSYGTRILASEDLVAGLPDGFLVRELDTLRVKGRRGGLTVYDVWGRRAAAPEEERFLAAWNEGLAAYRAGRFPAARKALEHARHLHPEGGDPPAAVLLDRMEALGEPPPDWDGIWTFTTK